MKCFWCLLLVLFSAEAHAAAEKLELYQGRAIVTGTGEETRSAGLAKAFEDVLVQVSGDPRLIADPRVAALARQAQTFVASFAYRDRMEGIPVHDEQGTRERPHDLTVTFDRARIDDALRSLGREPWMARPRIAVLLAVDNGSAVYVLRSDGTLGRDLREALTATAERYGLDVVLPREALLGEGSVTVQQLTEPDQAAVTSLAADLGAQVALVGMLGWNPTMLGWEANWRFPAQALSWRIEGVNFDAAFRSGLGGAAQVLSGNGAPR
jgi:uncharacterized protein